MPRYLTKSLYAMALGCPAKLYYAGKDRYINKNADNEFLDALARGGFQVGALAKCYYPGGHDIETLNTKEAIKQTNELLQQDNVVIFEAAFQVEKFFLRADIIEKKGNSVNLIEVKSKSFEGDSSRDMLGKKGYLNKDWKKYLYDVAFQKHVISKAKPDWQINAFLMLADKNAKTTVNGLNQKFRLREHGNGRTSVEIIGGTSPADLGKEILIRVNVDDICQMIYEGRDTTVRPERDYRRQVNYLARYYWRNKKIKVPIHKDCKECEFQSNAEEEEQGKISGFKECWKEQLGWQDKDFEKPLVLDIWNFGGKQKLIKAGIFHLDEVKPEHIGDETEISKRKLDNKSRQWLQVQRTASKDPEPYLDIEGIKEEMDKWVYPLHMIDFETSTVGVPFYRGRKPYEQTAFQFSHHQINKDGSIEHKGQYLNAERGVFPNFEFVRMLRKELINDQGSVFCYSDHENKVLCQILTQLQESNEKEVSDKQELIAFIRSITYSKKRIEKRAMIDLLDLVKAYYWHPLMGGSNSLKVVLPAVLNSSDYIKEKYSQPIYGKNSEIRSLNFTEGWTWIHIDETGKVISPYKILPPLFDTLHEDNVEEYFKSDPVADGGAAMTAYAMMQFTQMSDAERARIIDGLYRYCELDTMAMVVLWEFWDNSTIIKS
jgi:hypothetical protein